MRFHNGDDRAGKARTANDLEYADHATFPALYFQAVEGIRPDITIANKYGYPEPRLYQDMPDEQRSKFRKIPTAAEERIIEDWIISTNTDKPVYFTKKRGVDTLPGAKIAEAGLVYRLVRADEKLPERDYWAEYEWHSLDDAKATGELTAEMVLSDYHFARGRTLFVEKKTDEALAEMQSSIDIAGESKEGLNNVGSACAENGQLDAAEEYYVRATELDPEYGITLRNLGKVYMQARQDKRALPYFERLLKKDPLDQEVNWLAFDCLKADARIDDALAQLKRMATFPYTDFKVYREMGMLYMNEYSQPEMARRMFARSLQLNPDQPEVSQMLAKKQPENEPNKHPENPILPDMGLPKNLLPEIPGVKLPTPPLPQMPSLPTPVQSPITPQPPR